MENSIRKDLSLGILLTTFMILLNITIPSESKSVSELKHYFHGLENVTTIADNMEFEFLYSSNIERMLADQGESYVSPGALIAEEAAVSKCSRGKPYQSCLPPPNLEPKPDTCSTYKRGCPKPPR
ncbi:Detected protein of unknown function [Hibiscus syriacus]|uniref:Uncharacterized protein n=1 Tax=Hibiscus syriacus TaxID=106335 RepID=A0A6A3BEC5_HIBSY|nr:Detected protein of unknown function [Hibiscus syriacus]